MVPHKQSDVFKKMFDNAPPTVEVTEANSIPGCIFAEFPALTNLWKKHLEKQVALVRELGADDACIVKVKNFIKGGA